MPAMPAHDLPAWTLVSLRPQGEHAALRRAAARHGGRLLALSPWRIAPIDDAATRHALDTALRETEEEIGLHRNQVELLGCLPEYRTGTGFEITPVVGLVSPPFELKLDTFEVAEAFEVPLSFLLDTANHQRHAAVIRGKRREYYAMPYGDYFIWGATAGMIVSLYRFFHR